MSEYRRNIEDKIAQKLNRNFSKYSPLFYEGESISELINNVLILDKSYSFILTANPKVVAGGKGSGLTSKRGVQYTLGIFDATNQLGYCEGADLFKIITECSAQVLEILPRAKCKGVIENAEMEI